MSSPYAWLAQHACNITSQFGENGIIDAIFERIGTANKWCLEVGAADGIWFSNTYPLIKNQDWSGILIEADSDSVERLRKTWGDNPKVQIFDRQLQISGRRSLEATLAEARAPNEIDLVVIDCDGQDWFFFNSLLKYRPRLVVVEYDPNADPMFVPEPGGSGQAGLKAIQYVAQAKGYAQVLATQTNLFCVPFELVSLLEDKVSQYVAANEEDAERHRARRNLAYALEGSAETLAKVHEEDERYEVDCKSFQIPQYLQQPRTATETAAQQDSDIRVAAVMSTPRLGFLANSDCVLQALAYHGIPLARGEGAWWQHSLTRAIERQLEAGATHILTIDYDTVFTQKDVAKLVCFLDDNPQIDVAVPMQQKREGGTVLASTLGVPDMTQPGIPIVAGHFGLTLFRASVFERLSKPWFYERPDPQGSWYEGRTDSDMGFWENCHKNGISVYLALNTIVGHLEQVVSWPDQDRKALYQTVNDWRARGMAPPDNIFKRELALPVADKLDMGA